MTNDDGEIERHLTKISTANSTDAPMAGSGWLQLKDEKAARLSRVSSGADADDRKRGAGTSENEVAIEMELGPTAGPGGRRAAGGVDAGANQERAYRDDDGSAVSVTAAASERVYKVYKRRWFGLLQLTLLNIVASWDVSFFLSFFGVSCPGWQRAKRRLDAILPGQEEDTDAIRFRWRAGGSSLYIPFVRRSAGLWHGDRRMFHGSWSASGPPPPRRGRTRRSGSDR